MPTPKKPASFFRFSSVGGTAPLSYFVIRVLETDISLARASWVMFFFFLSSLRFSAKVILLSLLFL